MSLAVTSTRSICCSWEIFSSAVIVARSALALSRQACVGNVRPSPAPVMSIAPAMLPVPAGQSPPAPPMPAGPLCEPPGEQAPTLNSKVTAASHQQLQDETMLVGGLAMRVVLSWHVQFCSIFDLESLRDVRF